jgi:hypothetical protein
MEGVVERVDDMVDRLTCAGRSGLQAHDPSVKVPRERPEHMYVKVVLGGSEDKETMSKVQHRVRNGRSHIRSRWEEGEDGEDILPEGILTTGDRVPSLVSLLSFQRERPRLGSGHGELRHVEHPAIQSYRRIRIRTTGVRCQLTPKPAPVRRELASQTLSTVRLVRA